MDFIESMDVAMWAKNGARFLPLTLKRIEEVLPKDVVHRKIFIDDHSVDDSASIAERFGWEVYENPLGGIGSGFEEALKRVDCPFFASFEQDLLLSRDWWPTVPRHMKRGLVAVAQGWRVSSHPILRAIEKAVVRVRGIVDIPLYSIDNNIYRTDVVRKLAGRLSGIRYAVDATLRARTLKSKLLWVTDVNVTSLHLKPIGIREYVKRRYREPQREVYELMAKGEIAGKEARKFNAVNLYLRLLLSPIVGVSISLLQKQPWLLIYYPMVRVQRLKAFIDWLRAKGLEND
ncbi:MAG: glycosyltransferase family 2 protein [Candidatus Freyarchaeota archaeon]